MATKQKRKMVDATSSFIPEFQIKDINFTPKQRDLIRLIRDEKNFITFVEGPAGSAKTFVSTFCGLLALREHSIKSIKYIRSLVESSSNKIGFLPGDISLKLNVYEFPLLDQLEQMLDMQAYEKLISEKKIETLPVNFLRGRGFRGEYIIIDEAQNIPYNDLVTIITRIGEGTKFIFLGDSLQSDIRQSGYTKMINVFNDEESKEKGINTFKFTEDDVCRSEILKFIVKKLATKP